MKIEVGKYYKTSDGRKARIYAVDCGGHWTIHGAVHYDGFWVACEWMSDGEQFINTKSQLSLISEWTEPLDFDPSCLPAWANWIAMNEDGHWFWHQLKPTPTSDESKHIWAASGGGMNGGIHYNFIPKNFTGDWTESLFSVNELKKQNKL